MDLEKEKKKAIVNDQVSGFKVSNNFLNPWHLLGIVKGGTILGITSFCRNVVTMVAPAEPPSSF